MFNTTEMYQFSQGIKNCLNNSRCRDLFMQYLVIVEKCQDAWLVLAIKNWETGNGEAKNQICEQVNHIHKNFFDYLCKQEIILNACK